MTVSVNLSALRRTRWTDYAIRFLFGGLVTVATGLIAQHFGPGVGGLFLAFPAIFPASATLVEKNEIKKKKQAGLHGARRGAQAAALDAVGAAIGSIGLIGFGLVVWQLIDRHSAAAVLSAATVIWLIISTVIWRLRH
ncbi:MAG: DUF3147 family protein [Candidatus Binatus sp.]|uniref:DUF3147 family protein n=1 Tax=Candidatus Binatus sp. TaxID=2811406 RepID=UPI003BB0D324